MSLEDRIHGEILKLEGPIVVFGAGGFIGANLIKEITRYRNDVFAVTSESFFPWRLQDLNAENLLQCNIIRKDEVKEIFERRHYKTIFDMAAYGAYSKQDNVDLIYKTNVLGLVNLLETCSEYSIKSFVHAGSSSEYGLNSAGPGEDDPLIPNSHYAVTKVSAAHLIKYYGIVKEQPVVNVRFYSVFGPFEEPDRLIPKLIEEGLKGSYPPLVQPDISRDFVFVKDAVYACLLAANKVKEIKGKSVNIASGTKTTIRDIAFLVEDIFKLSTQPQWGDMPDRKWDLKEWYGNPALAKKVLLWQSETTLRQGLEKTIEWQKKFSPILYPKKYAQDKIRHKLSAVIACYKDGQAIPIMYSRLADTFKKLNVDYEIIFVNDGSPDNTNEVLQKIVNGDRRVIAIEHSRNFGSQAAFLSGMELSTGDAVVLLDGDLQDPPELIEQFYHKWKEGFDVVFGRRVAREGNQILVGLYRIFYRLFRSVSYIPVPLDAGDFSLMDRKVVKELVNLPETDQFMRGLRAWVGFRQTGVDYTRPERMFGKTTNNWRKNIAWARKAIFSFSFVPLELLTYLGWTLTAVSFLAIVLQIIAYFIYQNVPHGITTIIVLILFFGGLQMLAISIIGEYQAKLLEETKKRPKFIRRNVFRKLE